MKYVSVNSSNIEQIGYDKKDNVMEIIFKGGGSYSYADVPEEEYKALLGADSIGSYFHTIKGRYKFTKL